MIRTAGIAMRKPVATVRRVRSLIRGYRRLSVELAAMNQQYARQQSLSEQVGVVRANPVFSAIQQPREIIAPLNILEKSPPRFVCEIDTASGGTRFQLACVSSPAVQLDFGRVEWGCVFPREPG